MSKKESNSLSVIILAAGEGTRMKSELPKVMHKIAGKTMLDYVKDTAKSLSPAQIIMVVNEKIAQTPEDNVTYVIQKERLGTGHAVKVGMEYVADSCENVVILYGDTPFLSKDTLEMLVNKLETSALVVTGFHTGSPAQYGRLVTEQNKLLEIIEFAECSDAQKKINFCNSGIIAAKYSMLSSFLPKLTNNNSKKEYYLTDLAKLASPHVSCGFIEAPETEVLGVNSKHELESAEKIMQIKLRHQMIENGVSLIGAENIYFSSDTQIGSGSTIHPFNVFGPKVKLGKNVEIKSFSHLESCQIMDNAIVGPYARIRPGSVLHENTHIGNFVEIKNSEIMSGAKVNHLSYIGDSEIGSDTNIGAGTITCNYDGFKKSRTSIGSNVFVGSNSCLIAPVTIEEGAIIAAGSVITQNVPKDALAVARADQKNIESKAATIRSKKLSAKNG